MKQVKIIKNDRVSHSGIFESQEKADAWLQKHVEKNTFGLPERKEFDEQGNETGQTFPAEYEIVVEDISPQLEQEKVNVEANQFLASTDWKVLRHMRQKALGQQPTLSEQEYISLEQERSDAAAKIIR